MTRDEIHQIVTQLLKETAPEAEPSKLQPNENIRQVLNLDSFDALQFLVSLNRRLGVDIPEEDYDQTSTMSSLLSYLEKKMAQKKEF